MKKSALVMAIATALASSAFAAEVTMYGKVDVGLAFTSVDNGAPDGDRVNTLKMASGQTAGSRWGIRGEEDLGNGLKVGFKLESGFNTDDGTMAQGGRLFGRQASLFVEGQAGNLKFGRMGALASGFPDTGLFGGNMSPFAVGYGEVPGHRYIFAGNFAPLDNAITYTTPSFNGWKLMAQYSLDRDTKAVNLGGKHGVEGKSSADRHAALAAQFRNTTTEFNAVIDTTNYASFNTATGMTVEQDDSLVFTAGIRHSFDWVTLYVNGQIFKDARDFLQEANQGLAFLKNGQGKDGWGASVGVDYPALGGILKAQVGYMDAELSDDSSQSLKRTIASLGYWYDLSKRTALHANVGYVYDKGEGTWLNGYDNASCLASTVGIVHNF